MSPDFELFCSCEYGYFGDLCEHTMTTICLLDDDGNSYQFLHEFCLKSSGFCPLDVGNLFCANGGTCGITGSITSLTKQG